MSGLEKSRVVGKTDEEVNHFACNICLMILSEPMATQCCRQLYCKNCIDHWLEEYNNCPFDRQPLTATQLSPASRPFADLLSQLRVKCEYHLNGCRATPTLEELIEHIDGCDYGQCLSCGLKHNELKDANHKLIGQRRHIERLGHELCDWRSRYFKTRNRAESMRCKLILCLFIVLMVAALAIYALLANDSHGVSHENNYH